MASMDKLGLQTPITVYRDEKTGQPILLVGRHRLEAARRLGWKAIDARIVEWEPDQRRRWELSENVDRAELSALERADQIAELIRLEVRQSPDVEPTQPVSVSKGGRGKKGGIRHAANKLGLNREEARRSVKIAGLPVDAKKFAEKHGLANNLGVLQKAAEAKDPLVYLEHEVVRREKLATEAKKGFRTRYRGIRELASGARRRRGDAQTDHLDRNHQTKGGRSNSEGSVSRVPRSTSRKLIDGGEPPQLSAVTRHQPIADAVGRPVLLPRSVR